MGLVTCKLTSLYTINNMAPIVQDRQFDATEEAAPHATDLTLGKRNQYTVGSESGVTSGLHFLSTGT